MAHYYYDESREEETYSLPDCEVFYAEAGELEWEGQEEPSEAGWYFWTCLPGCMPDSNPFGPYATEEEALAEAREMFAD